MGSLAIYYYYVLIGYGDLFIIPYSYVCLQKAMDFIKIQEFLFGQNQLNKRCIS